MERSISVTTVDLSDPTKCLVCHQTVYAVEKLVLNRNLYHKKCFHCTVCNRQLSVLSFQIDGGMLYCEKHRPKQRDSGGRQRSQDDENEFLHRSSFSSTSEDEMHSVSPTRNYRQARANVRRGMSDHYSEPSLVESSPERSQRDSWSQDQVIPPPSAPSDGSLTRSTASYVMSAALKSPTVKSSPSAALSSGASSASLQQSTAYSSSGRSSATSTTSSSLHLSGVPSMSSPPTPVAAGMSHSTTSIPGRMSRTVSNQMSLRDDLAVRSESPSKIEARSVSELSRPNASPAPLNPFRENAVMATKKDLPSDSSSRVKNVRQSVMMWESRSTTNLAPAAASASSDSLLRPRNRSRPTSVLIEGSQEAIDFLANMGGGSGSGGSASARMSVASELGLNRRASVSNPSRRSQVLTESVHVDYSRTSRPGYEKKRTSTIDVFMADILPTVQESGSERVPSVTQTIHPASAYSGADIYGSSDAKAAQEMESEPWRRSGPVSIGSHREVVSPAASATSAAKANAQASAGTAKTNTQAAAASAAAAAPTSAAITHTAPAPSMPSPPPVAPKPSLILKTKGSRTDVSSPMTSTSGENVFASGIDERDSTADRPTLSPAAQTTAPAKPLPVPRPKIANTSTAESNIATSTAVPNGGGIASPTPATLNRPGPAESGSAATPTASELDRPVPPPRPASNQKRLQRSDTPPAIHVKPLSSPKPLHKLKSANDLLDATTAYPLQQSTDSRLALAHSLSKRNGLDTNASENRDSWRRVSRMGLEVDLPSSNGSMSRMSRNSMQTRKSQRNSNNGIFSSAVDLDTGALSRLDISHASESSTDLASLLRLLISKAKEVSSICGSDAASASDGQLSSGQLAAGANGSQAFLSPRSLRKGDKVASPSRDSLAAAASTRMSMANFVPIIFEDIRQLVAKILGFIGTDSAPSKRLQEIADILCALDTDIMSYVAKKSKPADGTADDGRSAPPQPPKPKSLQNASVAAGILIDIATAAVDSYLDSSKKLMVQPTPGFKIESGSLVPSARFDASFRPSDAWRMSYSFSVSASTSPKVAGSPMKANGPSFNWPIGTFGKSTEAVGAVNGGIGPRLPLLGVSPMAPSSPTVSRASPPFPGSYSPPTGPANRYTDYRLEQIDHDANFYRKFFHGKEHRNYVGVDDKIGPVIISLKRETVRKGSTLDGTSESTAAAVSGAGNGSGAVSSGTANNSSSIVATGPEEIQYRAIFRTKEGCELRAVFKSSSVRVSSALRNKPAWKDVILTVSPGLQVSKLKKVLEGKIQDDLTTFDEQGVITKYKFGVLYTKEGQTQENDMFSNEHGSEAFERFLDVIGEKTILENYSGFAGGLDTKNNKTGEKSVTCRWRHFEIMFHVSTYLPYSKEDEQQIARKRHIGNDIVSIVFQDGLFPPFSPVTVKSQFLHIWIVVRREPTSSSLSLSSSSVPAGTSPSKSINGGQKNAPSNEVLYRVAVVSNEDVPTFGPPLPDPPVFTASELRDFVLAKMINGENAAYKAPKFHKPHTRVRQTMLESIIKEYSAASGKSTTSSFAGGSGSGNTNGAGGSGIASGTSAASSSTLGPTASTTASAPNAVNSSATMASLANGERHASANGNINGNSALGANLISGYNGPAGPSVNSSSQGTGNTGSKPGSAGSSTFSAISTAPGTPTIPMPTRPLLPTSNMRRPVPRDEHLVVANGGDGGGIGGNRPDSDLDEFDNVKKSSHSRNLSLREFLREDPPANLSRAAGSPQRVPLPPPIVHSKPKLGRDG